MKYPALRRNIDGTEIVVHNTEEAYANPHTIDGFFPDLPTPEPEERNPDGLQVQEIKREEKVILIPSQKKKVR